MRSMYFVWLFCAVENSWLAAFLILGLLSGFVTVFCFAV
jgi:hypothetical protein